MLVRFCKRVIYNRGEGELGDGTTMGLVIPDVDEYLIRRRSKLNKREDSEKYTDTPRLRYFVIVYKTDEPQGVAS